MLLAIRNSVAKRIRARSLPKLRPTCADAARGLLRASTAVLAGIAHPHVPVTFTVFASQGNLHCIRSSLCALTPTHINLNRRQLSTNTRQLAKHPTFEGLVESTVKQSATVSYRSCRTTFPPFVSGKLRKSGYHAGEAEGDDFYWTCVMCVGLRYTSYD